MFSPHAIGVRFPSGRRRTGGQYTESAHIAVQAVGAQPDVRTIGLQQIALRQLPIFAQATKGRLMLHGSALPAHRQAGGMPSTWQVGYGTILANMLNDLANWIGLTEHRRRQTIHLLVVAHRTTSERANYFVAARFSSPSYLKGVPYQHFP